MTMVEIDHGFLGQRLLERGFRDWFLYIFRIIENRPFRISPLHNRLLSVITDVIAGKKTRININIFPRSAKTTLGTYLCLYAITLNPKAEIIYTGFSQDLLSSIAQKMAAVIKHPIYQEMYGNRGAQVLDIETNPVDEFWRDWLITNTHKETFSSHKITTAQGGVILLASVGSAITGFGAGIRGAKGFTGFIFIDDANKPADIRSEVMRKRVWDYFTDTLFTRLNNSDTPVINVQQRLHIEDLTGYLESVYGFETFRVPLLDADGNCALPEQYTPERVAELQRDNETFQAQYQQSPIVQGGNLIKTEWFKRYDVPPARYDSLYIVADTAFTEKKSADNSAFLLCGISGKDVYLLDGYCKKVIFTDLARDLRSFYQKACTDYNTNSTVGAIYIENKGSGISLIQQLRENGLPVREILPTIYNGQKETVADKYTRFQEIVADLESGYVHIPNTAPWLLEFIQECEGFTGGKQATHDDLVDCLIFAIKVRRQSMQTDWSAYTNSFFKRPHL